MSKAGYSDIVALLEYFDRKNNTPKIENPDDPMTTVIKMKRLASELNGWIEEQTKLAKKEDKPEKKGWDKLTFLQKVTILTATVPLCTMGYVLAGIMFVKVAATMLGMKPA
jgi:hypothetical protein